MITTEIDHIVEQRRRGAGAEQGRPNRLAYKTRSLFTLLAAYDHNVCHTLTVAWPHRGRVSVLS